MGILNYILVGSIDYSFIQLGIAWPISGEEGENSEKGVNGGSRWMLGSTGMNSLRNRDIYGITCK